MYHTLLPEPEHLVLHREYHVRLAAALCLALASALVVGICALFPAFLRASVAERGALDTVAAAKVIGNSADASSAELSADGKLLSAAASGRGAPRFSDAVSGIIGARSHIALTSVSLDRAGSSTISAVLSGVAPTRDELISFKSQLQDLSPGADVDLPIDELAKSSDIQFSMRFTEQLP